MNGVDPARGHAEAPPPPATTSSATPPAVPHPVPPAPAGATPSTPAAPGAAPADVAAEAPPPPPPAPTGVPGALGVFERGVQRAARPLTRTLRRKLVAAIVLCLLPLAVLFAVSISQRYADRRGLELSANREVAETLAVAAEGYVRNLDHQLRAVGFALARLDPDQQLAVVQAYLALNRLPYADLDQLAPTGSQTHPTPYSDVALLALVDPDGQVIAADPPTAVGVSLADAPYVAAARDAADLAPAVVSDLLLPAADDGPSAFALARAVRRPDGAQVGVLVAYVDTSALGRVLPFDRLDRSRGALVDRQGRLVYDSGYPDLPWGRRDVSGVPIVRTALGGRPAVSALFDDPVSGAASLGAAAPIPRLGWVATAERPVSEALAPIDAAARQEGLIFLLALLLALLVAVVLANTLTRPLRALQAAVLALASGDYGRRVAVETNDEVADLGEAYNAMAARLQALEEEREAFAAMVAHDLRSPLTAVRGSAQLLQQRVADDPMVQRRLDTIVRETDRVARLASDLGDASRAAAGRLELRPLRIDLVSLTREAVERQQAAGVAQPLALDAPQAPVWVNADPERIAQVLDNLIGNATKYSPPDRPIRVEVRTDEQARVCVHDQGPGVPAEELPHLFERFYRTRIARRGDKKGSGLGLYISHEIAQAHGGRITAESTPGAGSRFTLWLPLTPAPTAVR
ncbi:MAG TPA: sensor histidine kinase [Chloroflexota bacterium]